MKFQWAKVIQTNEVIKSLAYELLDNKLGDTIWQCQFVPGDLKHIFPKKASIFWEDVLKIWSEINFKDPISAKQVENQVIW